MKLTLDDWRVRHVAFATAFLLAYLAIANFFIEPMNPSYLVQFFVLTLLPAIGFSFYVGKMAFGVKLKKVFGLLIGYLAFDLFSIPQIINTQGITAEMTKLYGGTTDVVVADIFKAFGVSGLALYLCVYVLAPILGFILAIMLLDNERDFKNLM